MSVLHSASVCPVIIHTIIVYCMLIVPFYRRLVHNGLQRICRLDSMKKRSSIIVHNISVNFIDKLIGKELKCKRGYAVLDYFIGSLFSDITVYDTVPYLFLKPA